MTRKPEESPCWLVGTDEETGVSQVVQARLRGSPINGMQSVRVGSGCGVIHTIPRERVYRTQAEANVRLAELKGRPA
jgi:hypothetical protein